tara:strand:+ start:157 stop:324 length:168 start_codon:yes stop_codon:yes gene_type:complete
LKGKKMFCDICECWIEDRENDLVACVCDDCADDGWEEFDGQPDEMQEWHDFDPDC